MLLGSVPDRIGRAFIYSAGKHGPVLFTFETALLVRVRAAPALVHVYLPARFGPANDPMQNSCSLRVAFEITSETHARTGYRRGRFASRRRLRVITFREQFSPGIYPTSFIHRVSRPTSAFVFLAISSSIREHTRFVRTTRERSTILRGCLLVDTGIYR